MSYNLLNNLSVCLWYLFAYKTGPIFTWEIVDILFRLVYKTKERRQVTKETHFSVKVRLH